MENASPNFVYLLQTIAILVSEYFHIFEKLFSNTIWLFFHVIDSQVTMYFKIFNNLFIASLDTIRYLVNKHFKLINNLMVKNKTEHLLILSFTVIILNWNYHQLHHPPPRPQRQEPVPELGRGGDTPNPLPWERRRRSPRTADPLPGTRLRHRNTIPSPRRLRPAPGAAATTPP